MIAEHRYTRLQQMEWWRQDAMAGARAVVAGCGALGNEVVKNLLLLGWGHVGLVDFDTVSPSNLSRSVFFRDGDVGRSKVAVLAEQAAQLNPDCRVFALEGDLQLVLSSGLLARCDVVFGCLDSAAARLALSRLAGEAGTLLIDGGLTAWEGTVSIYSASEGPCYACGLTATDYRDLNLRRSCPAYAARAEKAGGIPTTPTVSSIVAAQMVQLGLKHLHGRTAFPKFPVGQQLRFDTAHERFWSLGLPRNPACVLHPAPPELVELSGPGWADTWEAIIGAVRKQLQMPDCTLHLPIPIRESWSCSSCGARSAAPRAGLADHQVWCTECGGDAVPVFRNQITGAESFLPLSPREMGFPPWLWVTAVDSTGAEQVVELGNVDGDISAFDRRSSHGLDS